MERVTIQCGDSLELLKTLGDSSVDSIVTDPPYHLTTGKKGGTGPASDNPNSPSGRSRIGTGFMGKVWDGGDVAFRPEIWQECLRVAKPGAHLLAFGGTRTFHRMMCAIEDAGWEIRDTVMWVYGSGFPKSLNVGKAIDKAAGAERAVIGKVVYADGHVQNSGASIGYGGSDPDSDVRNDTAPSTDAAKQWDGWGTALKPAWEPIVVARKPLEGTVTVNVQKYGTGAMNIDGCRVPTEDVTGRKVYQTQSWKNTSTAGVGSVTDDWKKGRWPANLIHDGSDEVMEGFPQTKSGALNAGHKRGAGTTSYGGGGGVVSRDYGDDSDSAARFFYSTKTSTSERGEGNTHPTVKPLALMRYLVKLVTQPNGVVLDPFMGSGSTGCAAIREGCQFIGFDLTEEYVEIARKRLAESVIENVPAPSLFD